MTEMYASLRRNVPSLRRNVPSLRSTVLGLGVVGATHNAGRERLEHDRIAAEVDALAARLAASRAVHPASGASTIRRRDESGGRAA